MSNQLELFFPPVITARGDGTYIVKPGKPQARKVQITTTEAAIILRRSRQTIVRWVDEGRIGAEQPFPRARLLLDRAEVEALAAKVRGEEDATNAA